MAQRVQVILEDDYDGGRADGTVPFAFDGVEYEIDLSEENKAALNDALAPWISHARKTGGRRGSKRASASSRSGADTSSSDIRAWAQQHGFEVSSRGRVSAQIKEAYEKAHA